MIRSMLLPLRLTGRRGLVRGLALGLRSRLPGLLVGRVGRFGSRLGRSTSARLRKEGGAHRSIGAASSNDRSLALVRLALAPAFDRHREIDARDFLIIAKLGLVGLLSSADTPRL